jgi:hypothetical protein
VLSQASTESNNVDTGGLAKHEILTHLELFTVGQLATESLVT